MAAAARSSQQHQRSDSHVPTFSKKHPMIPKLYVMPWKQDMKNQGHLMKNAALAGIPVVPHEESLCFGGRERLCHSQDSTHCSSSSSSSTSSSTSSSSSSAPLSQTGLTAHRSSHLSRYNSSVVTTRGLYQT